MKPTTDNEYLDMWYAALGYPLGLKFRIENGTTNQARMKLYEIRRQQQDDNLNLLAIAVDPDEPEVCLWIAPRFQLVKVPDEKEPDNA